MTGTGLLDKPSTSARRAPSFPSADLVDAAAGMFTGHRVPERTLGVTLGGDQLGPALAKSRELFPEKYGRRSDEQETELVEGPRFRLVIGPGMVAVRSSDPARRERALERETMAALSRFRLLEAGIVEPERTGGACVTSWSAKSRSRMVETIAQLDLAPLLARGGRSVMVTLTYPGPWRDVAPDSAACRAHMDALRKRWKRRFGVRLDGLWKREFQRRGAPHYHLWTVLPAGLTVTELRAWIGPTWAGIVGHPDPEVRALHAIAGCAVDTAAGDRATDPRRLGVYFSKEGSFRAKDYQNHAPAEWLDQGGSVGRFWGVWGVRKAVAAVEVHGDDALAAARILRRHSRANSHAARVPAWKHRTVIDRETGEVSAKWRKGTRLRRVYRMRGSAGYVVANDGPALASSLARALDANRPRPPGRSGPVGFLP